MSNPSVPNPSFMTSSADLPNLPLRQRGRTSTLAPGAPQKPKSLIHDSVFKAIYADNEKALTHFLTTKEALARGELGNLFNLVKKRGEPGPIVEYDNIPLLLSAMRNFLKGTVHGEKLVSYFREVVRIRGCYVVTTAEMLAYEIVYKMIKALFIFGNDQELWTHICKVVSEAPNLCSPYTPNEVAYFKMMATFKRQELEDANIAAVTQLVSLLQNKEFDRKHNQLIKANELHEFKLREIRKRMAKSKADHKAKVQAIRARNNAGLRRQMGMNGLTELNPHVSNAVVDYVEELSAEYFPHEDENVFSEEHLVSESYSVMTLITHADAKFYRSRR